MRRTIITAIGAATAAAMISGAGLAAASARPAASGTEHFQLMTTSATSNKVSAIFTGTFTPGGVDIEKGNPATQRPPGGTLTITHPATGQPRANPSTGL